MIDRERALVWLSRSMFAVALVAAASLILEHGFYLGVEQKRLLHLVDLGIVILFLVDACVRFAMSRRKLSYLRARWPAAALVAVFVLQILLVAHLQGRGWLPAFLATRSIFSLTKGYIVVLQIYLVFLIVGEAVRANRRVALTRVQPAKTVIVSFLLIILLGTLLLSVPRATIDSDISLVDALFTATSATCVTGLIVQDTGHYFTGFGQSVILILIQIGGLGLITFTAFFALVMRRGLGVRETLVLRGAMAFEVVGRVGRALRYMLATTFLLEAGGAALLFLSTRGDFASQGMAVSRSIFHSVSAFCNAGFSLFSTNFERYAGNVPVNLVMAALIIIGGLGFPVIMNALGHRILLRETRAGVSRWSVHTRIVVRMTVALLALGTVLFLVLEWGGALEGLPLWQKILRSFFGSVTARTAGFNTVSTAQLALPTLFLLSALMFIGGSPGGTAGGVKTVTLAVVLATIKSMFSGKQGVEMLKRQIPDTIVREALVVIAVALLVVSGAIFVLLMVEDGPLSKILFEVVSAFGTVGLSTGITPGLSATGKVVLMAVMLTGRIGPLTLALAVGRRRETALYAYPEERVVIG